MAIPLSGIRLAWFGGVAFHGCPTEVQDLHAMRTALRTYQEGYTRLASERLDWDEFDQLAAETKASASQTTKEGDDKGIEKRLNALKLEWLAEKFRKLDGPLRKKSLQWTGTL